jgi:putative heme transporter
VSQSRTRRRAAKASPPKKAAPAKTANRKAGKPKGAGTEPPAGPTAPAPAASSSTPPKGAGGSTPPKGGRRDPSGGQARPEQPPRHPVVQIGIYAWAMIGVLLALAAGLYVLGAIRLVIVPLVLALFPAALLAPVQARLVRAKVPPALAALVVLLGGVGLLVLIIFVLVPQVADEIPSLTESVQSGLDQLQAFLDDGPFGLDPTAIRSAIDDLQDSIAGSDILRTGVLGAAGAVAEIVAMLLLLLVVLFFYLKDGDKIAIWMRDLFPTSAREDVGEMATRSWNTIGAYFRGQLFVALVDSIFIGIGMHLIGVPLALPLGVLVFFGGLFPIVGAVATGAVAILVALASGGLGLALAALAIVIGVQQLEGNVLAPLVLGKATALHPLAVITVLTIGGILLGVLGAFIAVPIAASVARGVGYLRDRDADGATAAV